MTAVKKNTVRSFLGTLTGADRLVQEKSRLEAFLAAFPGEYCGFAPDGSAIFSPNFLSILGLTSIQNIHDIQNAINVSDSAVLEGMFNRLQEEGKSFSIDVELQEGKRFFRLSGSRGEALNKEDCFDIIWLSEITKESSQIQTLENARDVLEKEIIKFQNALENFSSAIWIRDANANLIWCNNIYAKIASDSPSGVIEKQKEIAITPKEKGGIKNLKEMARKALRDGAEHKTQGHIIIEGNRHFVEISESPITGSDNILGIARDISREAEIHTELNRHLAANKTLLEQLRSAIAIFGADQQLEFFNSAFTELWSLEENWLNSRPKLGDILEKLRETRRLPEQADFKNYKKGWLDMFTHLIDPHEDMLYLPDSTVLRLLVVPHPMGGLMMTFEDVTSGLELESSYNTLIAVQKETLDNLAEGVAVYGGDGRLKLCNPSFADQWGFNPEDLQNEPHITSLVNKMEKFFDGDKWNERKEILVSHGIERTIQEGRLQRTNNTLLEYTTVPLPDGGVLVSYFDVTDAVKVENALREKNAALEEAEQLKTDFLANVSYQLRTPLNAIMGFAEILNNQYFGELNDKQKEYSVNIQEAGSKLVGLIDDILDLATIEAGYLDLAMNEFDVSETLNGLYDLMKEWARKEKIDVSLDCPDNIGVLVADERRVKQILLNLIHNAINFTPEGGKIAIKAEKKPDFIEFTVSDTGIGISKTDLERVFQPFERANVEHRADMSSNSLSRGAGLGLSLVKNIVELHGGKVGITSEEGKGTTVSISLPLEPVLEPVF